MLEDTVVKINYNKLFLLLGQIHPIVLMCTFPPQIDLLKYITKHYLFYF